MPDEPDRSLLDRFVRGDEDAFEALFRSFQREVHGWVLRIVRNADVADDVLVEAFFRAYRGRARFDPSRSFGAWMRRIATNAALDHLERARRRGLEVPLGDPPAPVRKGASDDRTRESIRDAFRSLSPKLRVVATLALVEERPYAEIADALGVPVGTVKSRVFRATRALRRELASRGLDP